MQQDTHLTSFQFLEIYCIYNHSQNYWNQLENPLSKSSMLLPRQWLWTLTPDPQLDLKWREASNDA